MTPHNKLQFVVMFQADATRHISHRCTGVFSLGASESILRPTASKTLRYSLKISKKIYQESEHSSFRYKIIFLLLFFLLFFLQFSSLSLYFSYQYQHFLSSVAVRRLQCVGVTVCGVLFRVSCPVCISLIFIQSLKLSVSIFAFFLIWLSIFPFFPIWLWNFAPTKPVTLQISL